MPQPQPIRCSDSSMDRAAAAWSEAQKWHDRCSRAAGEGERDLFRRLGTSWQFIAESYELLDGPALHRARPPQSI
jgi:hypothetical protein